MEMHEMLEGLGRLLASHEQQMQDLLAKQMHSIEDSLLRITGTKEFQELKEKEPNHERDLELLKLRSPRMSPSEQGSDENHLILEKYVGQELLQTLTQKEEREEPTESGLQRSGSRVSNDPSSISHKVSASRNMIEDLGQSRETERSNTFHIPVTESYLNTQNVRIDRKKTDRHLKGCRGKLDDFLQSNLCEYTVAVIIVVNSVMFGVQADYAVKHPFDEAPDTFRYINLFFNIFFITELSLRLAAYGLSFVSCWNPDFKWNVLDSLLVSLSLFEEFYGRLAVDDGRRVDMTSARVMRLLRLVRVIRVFRVLRFFSDLRIMVMGIMGSFKALAWALLLLSIIIYVTGIIILQFIADAAGNNQVTLDAGPEFEGNAMFNSLLRCCFTLFLCISGGISWVEVVEPLEAVNGVILVPLLSLYVAFAVFCVLNIVTGVFVERSTSMRAMDEENMMFDELESRKKWLREIRHLFSSADKDGSGQVEWLEFQAVMADFQAQTAMKNLGFDTSRVSPTVLWNLIDYDNSGLIDIEEFAEALMKLHGSANAIDIARLRHDTQKIPRLFSAAQVVWSAEFDNIKHEVQEIKEAITHKKGCRTGLFSHLSKAGTMEI